MTKMGNIIKLKGMSLAYLIHVCYVAYVILIVVRLISSWFPEWRSHHIVHFVAYYTDPYLNFFRRLLPPIGGVLDISPVIAIFVLKFLEVVLLGIVR
jgi:YggT family protein